MSFQSVRRSHLARRDPRHIDLVPHRSQSAWTSTCLLSRSCGGAHISCTFYKRFCEKEIHEVMESWRDVDSKSQQQYFQMNSWTIFDRHLPHQTDMSGSDARLFNWSLCGGIARVLCQTATKPHQSSQRLSLGRANLRRVLRASKGYAVGSGIWVDDSFQIILTFGS